MKTGAFAFVLLLLIGCAAQPLRCGGRLTPINQQPVRSASTSSARGPAAPSRKGTHS